MHYMNDDKVDIKYNSWDQSFNHNIILHYSCVNKHLNTRKMVPCQSIKWS